MKNIRLLSLIGILTTFLLITLSTNAQNFRISGSNTHSVALCSDGSVFAWGLNGAGQLGLDPNSNGGAPPFNGYPVASSNTPVRVGGLGEVFQIDAGSGAHTLAMTCEGRVFAWGANNDGQLGNSGVGTGLTGFSATPVLVERGVAPDVNGDGFLGGVSYVSGGNDESFAILDDQRLVAWGQNDKGQLGDGTTIDRPAPVFVASGVSQFGQVANQPLQNVIQVEAGDENGYALTADGIVWSWGDATNGGGVALGRPIAGNTRARPVQINGGAALTDIVSLTAGDRHALMIDNNGVVWSIGGDWGPGQRGLGNGYQATNFAEMVVGGGSGETNLGDTDPIVEIAAGQAHSMAVAASGRLYTWGANGFFNCGNGCASDAGQLGVGTIATNHSGGNTTLADSPQLAMYGPGNPVDNAQGVSDGDAWTFVITDVNDIYIAGYNDDGQLGLGNNTSQGYFQELDLRSRGCGLIIPCPSVDLGLDFEVCPGFSHNINVGNIYPGFRVEYFLNGVEQTASEFSVPYNTNGIPMTAPVFNITQTGTWRVDIIDDRDPNRGERGCNPCPLATDELIISFPSANFADPGNLEFCGTSLSVNVTESGASTGTINDYNWYTELAGGTLLGSTQDVASTNINLTGVTMTGTAPNRVGTVYVEDVSSFAGDVRTRTSCTSGGTQPQRNDLQITIAQEIELVSLQVFANGNPNYNNFSVIISDNNPTALWNGSMNVPGPGNPIFTSPGQSGTATNGQAITLNVGRVLAPGTYWISTNNANVNVYSGCTAGNLILNNPLGNPGVTAGNNYQDNQPNNVNSPFFNLNFLGGSPYPCGRLPVTITENCPSCNKPNSVTTGAGVSVCPGEDVVNGDNITGTFADGGNPISNTSMYYVWYQSGTTPLATDYTAFTGTGPIPNLTVNNVTATNDGDWILRVQDGNDPTDAQCYEEGTVAISLNDVPDATLSAGGILCTEDLASNSLTVTASGGINTYSVEYTLGGTAQTPVSIATGTTGSISATTSGTYVLTTITDGNGCVGTITGETSTIDIHPDLTVVTDAVCDLATRTATVTATITDGVTAYKVTNETPGAGTLTGGAYSHSFLADGMAPYTYTIFDGTTTSLTDPTLACDNNSVAVDATIDCSCNITGTIALATGEPTELCPGDNTTIEVTPSGSVDGVAATYVVRLEEAGNPGVAVAVAPTISGGVHSFVVSAGGTYSILDIDDGNCTGDGPGNVIITELTLPVFTTDLSLANPNLCPGDPLNLQVVATGSPVAGQTALTYAWTRDAGSIGTNSNSYSVASVTDDATDGGVYGVSVTGECGAINSATIDVTVYEDVAITADLNTTLEVLCPGDALNLSITATGTGVQPADVLQYVWTAPNGVVSTTNSLDIASVVTASTGDYSVEVTGECGSVTSLVTPVDVGITTAITTEPSLADPDLCPGEDFTLTVGATGTPIAPATDIAYQWQKDGADISGETSATLTINGVDATSAGAYTVIVTGRCGTETSVPVNIAIGNPTVIDVQPVDASACAASNAQFTVTASGDNLSYQWRKEGVDLTDTPINITGSGTSSLSIDPTTLSDDGNYTVEVTGNCGVVLSDVVRLDITDTETPTVGLTVDNAVICEGDDAIFTANGGATGPNPTYEFRDADNPTTILQAASSSNIYTRTGILTDINVEVVMLSNSSCIAPGATNPVTAQEDVQVIIPATATITNPTNPQDTILVADDFFNGLNAMDPGAGYTTVWSKITSTQQGSLSSPGAITTNLTGLTLIEPNQGEPNEGQGTTDLKVTIQDVGGICPEAMDTITVVRKDITGPVVNDAELCLTKDLPYTVLGNLVIPGIETPSMIDVDDATGSGANFVYANNNSVDITAPVVTGNFTDFVFTYEINNSVTGITLSDNGTIRIHADPSTAFAGTDISTCAESVNLDADVPTIGTGMWSCTSGTLVDATDPKSELQGLGVGAAVTCTWTTSNGTCDPTSDDVVITRAGEITTPSIFLDGADVTGQSLDLCITDNPVLSGAAPVAPETGLWATISGTSITGVVGTTANFGTLNLATAGTTVISWTIDSPIPNCTPETRELTLIVHEEPVANILDVTAGTTSTLDTCAGVDLNVSTETIGLTDISSWSSTIVPLGGPDAWTIASTELSTGNNTITYTVDNPGCDPVSVSENINIDAIQPISVSINSTPTLCVGADWAYIATPTNGGPTPAYEFIEGGISGGSTGSNLLALTDVQTRNESIVVRMTSSLRCVDKPFAEASTNLEVIPGPEPLVITPGTTICVDSPIRIEGTDPAIGAGNISYQWLRDNQPVGDRDSLFLENVNISGTYKLVADNGICAAIESNEMILDVSQIPDVNAKANGVNPIKADFTEALSLSGSHSGTSATWSLSTTNTQVLNINDVADLNSGVSSNNGGQFIVVLTSFNAPCEASDSVVVLLTAPIRAPNVFTPNGDGENDTFFIEGVGTHPGAIVRIFNRWGKKVYETDNYPSNEWDGANVPDGVYYYVVELGVDQEKGEGHSGCIHIVR